ncbi:DUF2357 domain-containing protein [Nafulsella turpanensis]|uniref:DUF2357 domain-containing protein n=1 Tax=Nafulsella turpanensis TaxID=1265690 RepID=UPI0003448EB7|nr:DUF2357 domain-containing protein [Nafulsella turpanensis]
MANPEETIEIPLLDGSQIKFSVFAESAHPESLRLIPDSEAAEFGEAPLQLMEGFSYEYKIEDGYKLQEIPKVVSLSRVNRSTGRITPNIYVGSLVLEVLDEKASEKKGEFSIEVQSVKADYRKDYRFMLEDITEKCTDLLMQSNSPVTQNFTVDFNEDSQTLYQRFSFVKSIIETPEFHEAIHRIVGAPVTNWAEREEETDIRRAKRIGNSSIRQIASSSSRVMLPADHSLQGKLKSVPAKLRISRKHETVDTPENRFVKHAILSFFQFCADISEQLKKGSRAYKEAQQMQEVLESMLNHSVFKEVSPPATLALNSPVLQRKEGYREVLRVWLMFDLAAKLVWKGGEDVYHAGKRDVATLYEYWLFFSLLDDFKTVFNIEPTAIGNLIGPTSDGLGLKLKAGRFIPFKGVYDSGNRKLNIEFSFNRTFSGNNDYPSGGSWTKNMRPDYTLSIWPAELKASEAEMQELIVHIHFDAKYKIAGLYEIIGIENEDPEKEKEEQKQGNYKRADLLKMHAYRDAIRRTGGAYVLYPGDKSLQKSGFHELIPGLGAFPIKPSRTDNGVAELKDFIYEIMEHFLNRASQRERMSYRVYDIHKEKDKDALNEPIPEFFNEGRTLPPADTSVLIGFYKDEQHREWIERTGFYNARMNSKRGSLKLGPAEAGASYLLLHSDGKLETGDIWRITDTGPRVFSKEEMIKKGYPNPNQEYYLVYKIEKVESAAFANAVWNIRKLEQYKSGRGSALPFAVSLTELMRVKVNQ